MSGGTQGIRKLADKLFTPNEIRRFQAYKNRLSEKYLTVEGLKSTFMRPDLGKLFNRRVFSSNKEGKKRWYLKYW